MPFVSVDLHFPLIFIRVPLRVSFTALCLASALYLDISLSCPSLSSHRALPLPRAVTDFILDQGKTLKAITKSSRSEDSSDLEAFASSLKALLDAAGDAWADRFDHILYAAYTRIPHFCVYPPHLFRPLLRSWERCTLSSPPVPSRTSGYIGMMECLVAVTISSESRRDSSRCNYPLLLFFCVFFLCPCGRIFRSASHFA